MSLTTDNKLTTGTQESGYTAPTSAPGAPSASNAPISTDPPSAATAAALEAPVTPHDLGGTTAARLPDHPVDASAHGAHGTDSSFLSKVEGYAKPYLDSARPYVDSVAAQAKPYTDAALQKGKELKDKIEGKASNPDPNAPGEHTGAGPGAGAGSTEGRPRSGSVQDKAKSAWGYGLASLQSAVSSVGAAIDAKTATPEKPGLFTQMSSAVSHGVASIEKAVVTPLNPNAEGTAPAHAEGTPGEVGGASGAPAAAGAPTYSATTPAAPGTAPTAPAPGTHPIVTTTNTVPHNDKAGDEAL